MREAAAHGSAVSNHTMCHQSHRGAHQRAGSRNEIRIFDGGLSRKGLDGNAAITLIDPIEAANPVDVDKVSRAREAEVQERDERLAPGQHLRVL